MHIDVLVELTRKLQIHGNFEKMCIRDSNKCVTAFQQDYLDGAIPKISPELRERFEIFKSRDMLLEWCPKGVQKDRGLEALVAYLGIDASQVMACGDEANDASMLRWAGLGLSLIHIFRTVE